MKTNRRKFLGSVSLGTAALLTRNVNTAKANTFVKSDQISLLRRYMPGTVIPGVSKGVNPREVKVNVKLVYYALIHQGIWEGPCRYTGGGPGPEKEKIQYREDFRNLVTEFKKNLSSDAQMLEPVYFEFPEFKQITRLDLRELEKDKEDVDLYIVTGTNLSQFLASLIGDIYRKPVAHGRDTSAYLKSRGLEGYVAGDFGGMDKLISLLRARKAFQQTNILLITNIGIPGYPQTSSVRDFEDLRNRFGMGTTIIGFNELSDERERILKTKSSMALVEKTTEKLFSNAQNVNIGKSLFMGDVLMYHTVRNLMEKYNCNAFSSECFEMCGTRLPDNWKAFPCLTHSLLRDSGFPSACEGDVSALLTLALFMAISKTSSYMGNMNVTWKGGGLDWDKDYWVKDVDIEGEKLWVGHNVPGLKMLGFDKPDLPYGIAHFVKPKPDFPGWGGTLKIDFTKIEEKTVTVGRFDPLAKKILITKGEVIGTRGLDYYGCNHGVILNTMDPAGYQRKSSHYGHHFVLTFGDYTKELQQIAEMIKIEVESHAV